MNKRPIESIDESIEKSCDEKDNIIEQQKKLRDLIQMTQMK